MPTPVQGILQVVLQLWQHSPMRPLALQPPFFQFFHQQLRQPLVVFFFSH
ncbi:MAG: hypothetical protein Q8P67_27405 [archaeon]|nr:hypothetical protein [archaeon]